jgi:predicted phage-related endonuclease
VAASTPRKSAQPAKKAAPRKAAPAAVPAIPVDRPVKLDALAADIEALRRLETQLKRLNDKKAPLVAAIKERMGDATQGLVGGVPVVRWSTTVRRTLDSKMIREKYPDVAAATEKLTEVRTFQLIEQPK